MPKKRTKSGQLQPKLSKVEIEVLHLLTKEFFTINQIAIRRKTGLSAIYKIRRKLIEKGALTINNQIGQNFQSTIGKRTKKQIRLHGQEFNIQILFKDHRYSSISKKSNLLSIDGNTVRLYKNSLEIYSGQSFYADDVQKATSSSMHYWSRFFTRVEHELNVIILKPRYQNIKLVNHHYSEIANELSEEAERKGYKIRVYTTDDCKLWFTIDNSFNLHEAETIHPESAKQDMEEVIKPFFNDLRDNKPPTLSKIMELMHQHIEINKETASGLNSIVSFLESQIPKKISLKMGKPPEYIG